MIKKSQYHLREEARMNQLGLFHLALSKNAEYPILWQVWCGNYDQSLGCGLPFFWQTLDATPLATPNLQLHEKRCTAALRRATPAHLIQGCNPSRTHPRKWNAEVSLSHWRLTFGWMLDHLMFGLPSLFFCRIRLVELVKSKANFRPRLWTLNSTSAKPYDFILNILAFRTSQAVSADAIGAPVQDHIQIWSNQICTDIKCSCHHLIKVEQLQGTLRLTWTILRQCWRQKRQFTGTSPSWPQ